MGDMADFALDCSMDEVEHFERFYHAPVGVQYEEGLVNEYGGMEEFPGGFPARGCYKTRVRSSCKPVGPGPCPVCNDQTRLITGVNGKFYGCLSFPECKGSRNFV